MSEVQASIYTEQRRAAKNASVAPIHPPADKREDARAVTVAKTVTGMTANKIKKALCLFYETECF